MDEPVRESLDPCSDECLDESKANSLRQGTDNSVGLSHIGSFLKKLVPLQAELKMTGGDSHALTPPEEVATRARAV